MKTKTWCRPDSSEYAAYYEPYMKLTTEEDLLEGLQVQISEITNGLQIDESQAEVFHEPYTWTIKQVVGHMIDNERVFAYRAARFATGDTTNLPGYEQDDYVSNSDYQTVRLSELTSELIQLRESNIGMLKRIKPEAWSYRGQCDGREITVRAIACLLIGHLRHHLQIISKRIAE